MNAKLTERNPEAGTWRGWLATRVLVVTQVGSRPTHALVRAVALARRLHGSLSVVVARPPQPRAASVLFPHRAARAEIASIAGGAALEDKLAWVAQLAPSARVLVVEGVLSRVAIEASGELEVDLVVVPDEDLGSPLDLVEIAEQSGAPALLARAGEPSDALVVATDLREADAPVLRAAADLATQLEAAMVAVHNVPTLAVEPMTGLGPPVAVQPSSEDLAHRGAALDRASAALPLPVDRVLTCEARVADAVLATARDRGADVVVVGTYGRSWLERLVFGSTAREILGGSRRSVLVVPIGAAGRGAAPTHAS